MLLAVNKCSCSYCRAPLPAGKVPANQVLVGEYLSLPKSSGTISSRDSPAEASRFTAALKGESCHYFPSTGGKTKHQQGRHTFQATQLRSPLEALRPSLLRNHADSLLQNILHSLSLEGFTSSQTLNNHYRTGIKGLLTF